MEEGQVWIGKRIKVIFQDSNKVLIKIGVCKSYDSVFLNLDNDTGINEIIPLSRILRIEVLK